MLFKNLHPEILSVVGYLKDNYNYPVPRASLVSGEVYFLERKEKKNNSVRLPGKFIMHNQKLLFTD